MSTTAIRVRGIGKHYQLGVRDRGYTTFREALIQTALAPFNRFRRLSGKSNADESFWALKDVNFDIHEGEVVGIIGRNGAGKSTMLKILSQITEPTTGEIELHGRVGSLLEVGTGFHPELSGRENIYLNGAILGMKRREIDRKFDEIVAFSEVEKFLDTPVKRYSSGMQTRLAFSVAAHLEPEVMIVDEVLAVGDVAFQEKCLGKMGEVSRSGRTILFVSHNMAAVEALCTRAMVLEAGRVTFDGNQVDAIRRYFEASKSQQIHGVYQAESQSPNSGRMRILRAAITSNGIDCRGQVLSGAPIEIHITCSSSEKSSMPEVGIGINNKKGLRLVSFHTKCDPSFRTQTEPAEEFTLTCKVPRLNLVPSTYDVILAIENDGHNLETVDQAMTFSVLPSDFFGNAGKRVGGLIFCEHSWAAS